MTAVLVWRRLLGLATVCTVLVLAVGVTAELTLLGRSDQTGRERGVREIRSEVAAADGALADIARDLAGRTDVRAGMTGDRSAIRRLFDEVEEVAAAQLASGFAATIYDARDTPRAWSGRGTALGPNQLRSGPSGFVDIGQSGLHLVRVEPLVDPGPGGPVRRLGSVVVERLLSTTPVEGTATRFVLTTSVGRAEAGPLSALDGPGSPDRFEVVGADGRPRFAATLRLGDVAETRARWREGVLSVLLFVLAVVALAAGGLVLATRQGTHYLRTTLMAGAAACAAWGCMWLGAAPDRFRVSMLSPTAYRSPAVPELLRTGFDLLLTTILVAVLVALVADLVNRWRWSERPGRGDRHSGLAARTLWAAAVGAWVIGVLVVQHQLLLDTVTGASVDVMHTALVPFDTARAAIQLALVLASAATVWVTVLALGVTAARWPAELRRRRGAGLAVLALVPAAGASGAGWIPPGPAIVTTLLALVLAWRWPRLVTWFRHTDPFARTLALVGAVLLPVLPLYLALSGITDEAKRRQLEDEYARQTADHPYDLQDRLAQTQLQIDAMPNLASQAIAQLPARQGASGRLDTDRAFGIWQQTALADSRLTSSVELYDGNGELTSRFALNMPDYAVNTSRWSGLDCEWVVFGETSPFGAEDRRTLHAERAICAYGPDGGARILGGVVVHVAQVDYESLAFIGQRGPYVDLFQPGAGAVPTGAPGHAVELVIYGWGLRPIFVSSRSAWSLDDALFQRIYASRTPFWTRLSKGGTEYDVHITNDPAGIYVLGYPVHTRFDHFLHLSELAILVLAAFAIVLGGVLVVGALFPGLRPPVPFREVRARFALKLQLWFLAVAAAPVVVAAVLIQGYFAEQLRNDIEAGAARTAAVARSVIEESAVIQPAAGPVVAPFTDQGLVWISQVVGQDVNIFDGARLLATSERDLYASGLLSTRTPDKVYRAIFLDQLPSFVGEDAIGALTYQLAAAPVQVAGQNAILTVPLASRQQEIENQIEELNRRVAASTLFFVMLVGFIGWGIARSIADPVRRLTRATSRVARGEFSAQVSANRAKVLRRRVAERSADELDVLEADFNRMAVELEEQRRQLERTHRLEAWSEMARQVAHEIKNPLTPVQLNAEHLRRVHADRGAPLSPVLEGCVSAILKQVRILRQIASEFSSYASSPVADRVPTQLADLIEETVGSYRSGLESRVEVVVDVPDGLPPFSLDRVLMQRALTNIIENALHAMPAEGRLSIGVEADGDRWTLVVADTGVGLEPEALARIFEPYFSTKVTGTGLGMAIAKRNVELNGGTIAVTSEAGRGTRVAISLPAALSDGASPQTPRGPNAC